MLALFVFRRLLAGLVLLLLISFLVFGLLQLAPGSPERLLLGRRPPDPAVLAQIRKDYHLDDSFTAQYLHWLGGAVQFDFGRSVVTQQPVAQMIDDRAPVSVLLGLYAFIGTVVIGVLAGMVSALRDGTLLGRSISAAAFVGLCAPAFAVSVVLLYVFAVALGWFPTFGAGAGLADRLYHLTLPAIVLIVAGSAYVIQLTRTGMLTSLGQDYVAFARARGLTRRRVMFGHALRNALIPIVTTAGGLLPFLLTGAVIVETTFTLPGLGTLMIVAVKNQDIPLVQAMAMLIAIAVILGNLLTDIAYLVVDPRIRFGAGAQ
jgi:peptide/nickel transport system permease protein